MINQLLRNERVAAELHAEALRTAAAHAQALKAEAAALSDLNACLRDENKLLGDQAGISAMLDGSSIASAWDEVIQSRDRLAAENATLLAAMEAIETDRTALALINRRLQDDTVVLQAERKRAMADQWLLKQLNADLQSKLEHGEPLAPAIPSAVDHGAGRVRSQAQNGASL
ncbi:hypothetical protein [Methylobacterium sp. J-077]|uniref:hypothetical protein n=1 Tax=Methylobacterium sp. J-077 TaxID=2836656 RepID=UPI001FBBA6EA|nr:hypothetical protein [Methylobacterium sp. J-077]MCJ2126405.1 hypothetical protein [Methylobacterium sp. J-077]